MTIIVDVFAQIICIESTVLAWVDLMKFRPLQSAIVLQNECLLLFLRLQVSLDLQHCVVCFFSQLVKRVLVILHRPSPPLLQTRDVFPFRFRPLPDQSYLFHAPYRIFFLSRICCSSSGRPILRLFLAQNQRKHLGMILLFSCLLLGQHASSVPSSLFLVRRGKSATLLH